MAHDVFISYSQKDKASATAICAGIELHGFRCWIAPRDVPLGADWGESIVDAIGETTVFILVFTANANASPQVKREVQIAFEHEKVVIPFRLDETKPGKSLEYYVTSIHWLDAFTEPLSQHIDLLAERLAAIMGTAAVAPAKKARAARNPPPARGEGSAQEDQSSVVAPQAGAPAAAGPDEAAIIEQVDAAVGSAADWVELESPATDKAEAAIRPQPPAATGLPPQASPIAHVADASLKNAWAIYRSRPWPWIARIAAIPVIYMAIWFPILGFVGGDPRDKPYELAVLPWRFAIALLLIALSGVGLYRLAGRMVLKDRFGDVKNGLLSAVQIACLYAVVLLPLAVIDTLAIVNCRFTVLVDGDPYLNNIFDFHEASGAYLAWASLNTVLAAICFRFAMPIGALLCRKQPNAVACGFRAGWRSGRRGLIAALAAVVGVSLGAIPPMFMIPLTNLSGGPVAACLLFYITLAAALCLIVPPYVIYATLLTANEPEERTIG